MKDEDIDENEMMCVIVIVPIENGVNSGKCVPLARTLPLTVLSSFLARPLFMSCSHRHLLIWSPS